MNIWSILCLIWTLAAYVVAKRIYQKNPKLWLSPAISVPVLTIILMTIFGISYQTYAEDTQWIVNLLGPATVAFAVPIYRYRETIRKNLGVLSIAIIVGMSVGVMSAYEMAQWFHFSPEVTNSLMARSISFYFNSVCHDFSGRYSRFGSIGFTIYRYYWFGRYDLRRCDFSDY